MIPDTITLGHLVMLLGLLVGLYGVAQLLTWTRHRGYIYGTPQYARARDGRRFAIWSFVAAALLLAIGCLTPLSEMAIR